MLFKKTLIVALAFTLALAGIACAQHVEGDALVVFKLADQTVTASSVGDQNMTRIAAAAKAEGIEIVKTFNGLSALSIQNAKKAAANGLLTAAAAGNDVLEPGIFMLVHSDTLTTDELLAKLSARDDVLAVSPNLVMHMLATPNEPAFNMNLSDISGINAGNWKDSPALWGIKATRAPEVWSLDIANSTGSSSVYVAVIDTGIDYENPDISPNFDKTYSKNYWYQGNNPSTVNAEDYMDYNGHGTHVAGTIAAAGNNGKGVVGMTWNSKLIALRSMDPEGNCEHSEDIDALNSLATILAENPDLDIAAVNLSLGGYSSTSPEKWSTAQNAYWRAYKILDYADRLLIVVAASNEAVEVGVATPADDTSANPVYRRGQYCYPASLKNLDNFLVVGAANPDKSFASTFSNYSTEYVHVAAPGRFILSTCNTANNERDRVKLPGDNTPLAVYMGTSMAAPHVAGAVALLKSVFPDATPGKIKQAICEGADSSYCKGTDTTKYGFLDVKSAYDYLKRNQPSDLPVTVNGTVPASSVTTPNGKLDIVKFDKSQNVKIGLGDWYTGARATIKIHFVRMGVDEVQDDISVDADGSFTIPASEIKDNDELEVYAMTDSASAASTESKHVGLVFGDGLFYGMLSPRETLGVAGSPVTLKATWVRQHAMITNVSDIKGTVTGGRVNGGVSGTNSSVSFTPVISGTYKVSVTADTTVNGETITSEPGTATVTVAGGSSSTQPTSSGGGGGGCAAGLGGVAALVVSLFTLAISKRRQ